MNKKLKITTGENGSHSRKPKTSRIPEADVATDDLNFHANPGAIIRLLEAIVRARNGDFKARLPSSWTGVYGKIADAFNELVGNNSRVAHELSRVGRLVGKEGRITDRAQFHESVGAWGDMLDSINGLITDLVRPTSEMARVIGAVAKGDLTQTMTTEFDGHPLQGEFARTAKLVNSMVEQLGSFSSEVTRVAREVGTEGKLGGQAQVKGVAGTWKDLTESVNSMANNLTAQVRNIADVTIAVASGDLSRKITVDVRGEILQLKDTINTMVDQLRSFSSEVTRVAREVGTDGKLGGQAVVPGVAGVWKELTVNVNSMANNLTGQVRNIAQVTTAVASGDLSKKITAEARGEILELKNTINTMVDQLNSFAAEVTRVAREVGTEGKLGGQAQVKGVSGTWKDLTENVNFMASNLTSQVRNIAQVTTAVASGDLSKKITAEARGEILELKNTINTMVDQLNSFAAEVTRVAREVGTEGKLGGQAQVTGVSGTWKDLTENVNFMANNLTSQVRNIAEVTISVANGNLSKKITVDVKGEILELKNTINTMVDQLNSFAAEVTRVAREVGTEGKLGGQAVVPGVAGTWKELTENVNSMANNLTGQVRNIAQVTTAVASGDLSKKITAEARGEILELKNTINTMVDQLNSFAAEVTRVAREVGTEGKLGGQAQVKGVSGTWKDLTENVNFMASNLTSQVRNIAQVTTAVATGDLSKKITVDVKGEILELKNTINTMVDQLNSFAAEVTRVAREVGTEGKLGGQAEVRGVSGTWKDLTDNVNSMAANLTDQVRGIAKVVTAVANGSLQLKLAVEAKGEIAELAETINNMINTLATFADQVTTVAREVGVEGQLGGQANVPGAAGTWKDLTDNVNRLAANLTTQVRAIAEVATAVTKGDLSRTIQVEARGEVEELKTNLNEMIRNLKETTQTNSEQDWLKTNIAKFTRLLQGQRDLLEVSKMTLSELAPLVGAQHGIFYVLEQNEKLEPVLHMQSTYGFRERKVVTHSLRLGESLVGQAAIEKQPILLNNVPSDYVQINSGLGEAPPLNVIILPVLFEGQSKAVIEVASFERFSATHRSFLEQLTEGLGIVINTIQASTRTEDLLKQSQSLASELQAQQQKLQQTNAELGDKARLLEEQKIEVERKNQEVELAKSAMEEKAEQLALTSKYKSEFLSNMSHELRTPLNSLLILAQQLAENRTGNLEPKQVEFSRTIQNAGQDLLALINDILDLSKIESGTVTLDLANLPFHEVEQQMNRVFRHLIERKGLGFVVERGPALPQMVYSDAKRLQQILKNLLSNSLKFTEHGHITLRMDVAQTGWNPDRRSLNEADTVIAISVSDSGIGIARSKQKIVFEAFQQADGSTARKYGGTGLGLAISRELATLLGGELTLQSEEGKGSVFTLFLPRVCKPTTVFSTDSKRITVLTQGETGSISAGDDQKQVSVVPATRSDEVLDDRTEIASGDNTLLIVEDDFTFATVLRDAARTHGLKCVVARTGEAALQLASQYTPSGITLDINLPDVSGWAVLDSLKSDLNTRHIPVTVLSATAPVPEAMAKYYGAFIRETKPSSQEGLEEIFQHLAQFNRTALRRLLIVTSNEIERIEMTDRLKGTDVQIVAASEWKEAMEVLENLAFACVVTSWEPEHPNGSVELLEKLSGHSRLRETPVVLKTHRTLSPEQISEIKKHAGALNVRMAPTAESVFAETALFLHRDIRDLGPSERQIVASHSEQARDLNGLKVLIVDDDIRNIFALTSLLEDQGLQVVSKDRGEAAIELLKENHDISVVLMDMMMPEVDGYETIRRLRSQDRFKALPIIALTAKAMKGDREKCIAAGASDYLSKPVNKDQLLTTLRIWSR